MSERRFSDYYLQILFFRAFFQELVRRGVESLDVRVALRTYPSSFRTVIERRTEDNSILKNDDLERLVRYLYPDPINGSIPGLEQALAERYNFAHIGDCVLLTHTDRTPSGLHRETPESVVAFAKEVVEEILQKTT